MKKRIFSLFLALMLMSMPVLAQVCALCGGDGVCDTCLGNGYLLMQAYDSEEKIRIACTAGCDDGKCPDCSACEVCGGLGYLLMQAYGSDEKVKIVCTNAACGAGMDAAPAVENPAAALEEKKPAAAPDGSMLLVSPAEYTTGRVFFSEDESSWEYATTSMFDIGAYIERLCADYGMTLDRINDLGKTVFYDLKYTNVKTGKKQTLSLYTFSGGQKFELTVIKPSAGGVIFPEFTEGAEQTAGAAVYVPDSMILLTSPAEYASDKVYLDESTTSWMYTTKGTFDMDGYISHLSDTLGMKLQEVSETGSCIFYDLGFTNRKTGKNSVLCMYTFTSSSGVELSIIKPDGDCVTLPEFYGQEAVTAKETPMPTAKPQTGNKFENAMEAYLKKH